MIKIESALHIIVWGKNVKKIAAAIEMWHVQSDNISTLFGNNKLISINDLSEKLSTMPPLTCRGTGKLQLTTQCQIFFHTIRSGAAGLPNCPFSGHTPFVSTRNSWWRAGRGAWHHPIWRPWRRGCAAGGTTRAAWARELFRQCRWHRHLWGTAVTLQVRDWSTYSNPNNQSKKHCDWRATHWVQFGGSGREHWSQDCVALDAQFSMWAPTAKWRISQVVWPR